MQRKKLVIVGGVAGGASAATRARRLSEEAEIILFERGPYVSYANCGLPYYIGGEIPDREELLVQTPESLWERYRLDVRVRSEVIGIDRQARTVRVRDLENDREYEESYDALILSPGAAPIQPPIPNLHHKGHFVVRTIPDVETIDRWIRHCRAQTALIVGGGFIGLEMVEQLLGRGLNVTLVEALPQVFPPMDPEMAAWILSTLEKRGITVYLNDPVMAFDEPSLDESAAASVAVLKSGRRIPADIVILAMGVKPEVGLAEQAGLEIGELGGIRVNEHMQTSDPNIWAVGDAVEVKDLVTGQWTLLPLAGPAVRQARVAADNIFGRSSVFRGVIGTSIVRVFDCVAGCTGASEKRLKEVGIPYFAVHLHPLNHAEYYPGASTLHMKVLFHSGNGRLLGAQIVGKSGVDKRIDVFATALMAGMTADDLVELELGYAPPFGAPKDPVNVAGMIAQNVLQGRVQLAQWDEVDNLDRSTQALLDVRTATEWKSGHIPGALHIPLQHLRDRLDDIPKDMEIIVICRSGNRSYYATRILQQRGYKARNLTGSYLTWKMGRYAKEAAQPKPLKEEDERKRATSI